MSGTDPTGIKEILESLKSQSTLGRNLDEARIWEKWPDVVGAKLMPYGRPLAVREGTLVIEVVSAVWLHRFSYQKSEIIRRSNALLEQTDIQDVYLTLAPEESEDDGT